MDHAAVASEFQGLIRRELDIETLLRLTLEFTLTKVGPTNAAVFLPTTTGDYSLGAYVNYSMPKDTAEMLLDHLADDAACRFEDIRAPKALPTDESAEVLALAPWLDDMTMVGFGVTEEDECLAVITLFREPTRPYSPDVLGQVRTIGDLFAQQLARIVRIHHRHLPRELWGRPGDPHEDQLEGFDDADGSLPFGGLDDPGELFDDDDESGGMAA